MSPAPTGGVAPDYLDAVAERLAVVRARIAGAGGDLARVRILAVTKGFGLEAVRAAVALGCVELGENYAQELVDKAVAYAASGPEVAVRWHFLGAIQRNKLARLAPHVHCYEALDRVVAAQALAARAPGARVLVEVDTTGDPGRAGVAPGQVAPFLASLEPLDLEVAGLMTVAPAGGGAAAHAAFERVAALAAEFGLAEVSMGMSDDLELAVAAGATIVRVGRALFGDRPARDHGR